MACRVRYLNSAGIHVREIPGIDAIARAFPAHWLLYASLQWYPRKAAPIEIDAMVVMDDRVLLLEIKDWNGLLTSNGDVWLIDDRPRGRSPVDLVGEKARKLKTFFSSSIPGFSQYYVDSRVILTGSSNKERLPEQEKKQIWDLAEACSISDVRARARLLSRIPLSTKKVTQFEPDFERFTRNGRTFGPSETNWDGYRVVESDIVGHPEGIWREHRAERIKDPRFKGLVRAWAFDKLPPGLNSPENRRQIADRENRSIGRLTALGSDLVRSGKILRPIGADKDEILTQHFELRELSPDLVTLDRFLNRMADEFEPSERLIATASLLNTVAELHDCDVAHRDLGPRSIWISSPTRLALSGLMASQLPEEASLGDWVDILRGYGFREPAATSGSGKQRDVYALGRLAYQLLASGNRPIGAEDVIELQPPLERFEPWLRRALSTNPGERFANVRAMADELATLSEQGNPAADQATIDRYETEEIPYARWPITRELSKTSESHTWLSNRSGLPQVVVKVWPRVRRNLSAAVDLSMVRMFEGVSSLVAAPLSSVPKFVSAGLSAVGPFLVYEFEEGTTLEHALPKDRDVALSLARALLQSVDTLHSMGITHSDVAPKNLLMRSDGELRILDLFDISSVGDGRVRTTSYCPEGWENLTNEQCDRYSAIVVARQIIKAPEDASLTELDNLLGAEVLRPAIESLEPALAAMQRAAARIAELSSPQFILSCSYWDPLTFESDAGGYYLRATALGEGEVEYRVVGLSDELVLLVKDGGVQQKRFDIAEFRALATASQQGVKVSARIRLARGPDAGFVQFLGFIAPLVVPVQTAKAKPVATTWHEEPESEVLEKESASNTSLDIRRYWERILDLETQFQPEIEIVRDVSVGGNSTAYVYERVGREFEFDDGSEVVARLTTGRRVGDVDLNQLTAQTIVIRHTERTLMTGDRLYLEDRRSRTSLDRRLKAVKRILEGRAEIGHLVDYFTPSRSIEASSYDIPIDNAVLDGYNLNEGQQAAFRSLAQTGPVGLLQGPPGTGKTHFIASFAHWLINHVGAQRILITSQSNEAVNNAIEALVKLFGKLGGRPSLLRIGSKGITDKIRPYHTDALRERYRTRFDLAFRHRVTAIGSAAGLSRQFVEDALEIDRLLGVRARQLVALSSLETVEAPTTAEERRRDAATVRNAANAFREAGIQSFGREVNASRPIEELSAAFDALVEVHRGTSPADVALVRNLIDLSREWSSALGTSHRNFDEFLAKTRSIITATCVGVGQTKIRIESKAFDWVIVDEAARCTPGELAVPIQLGRRVLLVGDHLQLKPMIDLPVLKRLQDEMSDSSLEDLKRSDFERSFTSSYGKRNGQALTEQYRMTPQICALVSKLFYEPHHIQLITSPDRVASPIASLAVGKGLEKSITWVDTSHDPRHIEMKPAWSKVTYWNPAEIEAVLRILERIAADAALVRGLQEEGNETPIGVICMYMAQRVKLEDAFLDRPWEPGFRKLVRIDTVDAYQGKENAIVIVSLVRCNDASRVGHVSSLNRANVALSRAKERLFIVGAKRMWSKRPISDPFRQVLDHISITPESSIVHRTEKF